MHTTIGACAFHFRVRDGIGWYHSAVVTRERVEGRRLLDEAAPRSQGVGKKSDERLVQAVNVLRPRVSFDESKKLEVIWSSHTDH